MNRLSKIITQTSDSEEKECVERQREKAGREREQVYERYIANSIIIITI